MFRSIVFKFEKTSIKFISHKNYKISGHFTFSCAVTNHKYYSSNGWHLLTSLSWVSFLWLCIEFIIFSIMPINYVKSAKNFNLFPVYSYNSFSFFNWFIKQSERLFITSIKMYLHLHELLLLFDLKNVGIMWTSYFSDEIKRMNCMLHIFCDSFILPQLGMLAQWA